MDLTNLFTAQTKSPEQSVICIILTDTTVQALLLGLSVTHSRAISQSMIVPYTDQKTLVLRTDQALQDLGQNSEKINEVLFAVQDSWLQAGDVAEHRQILLKAISDELSLKPMGFVVQSEALFQHYLNLHPQFSAVLLVVGSEHLTVQVVRQGRLRYSTVVGRSENSTADFKEALARYVQAQEGEVLPAKIVCSSFVLAPTELKELQQQLLQVDWGEAVSFVQSPGIDILDTKQAVQAVAEQAAQALMSQIAPELQAAMEESTKVATAPVEADEPATSNTKAPASEASSFGVPISSSALAATQAERAEHAAESGNQRLAGSLAGQTLSGAKPRRIQRNPKLFIIGGVIAGIIVLILAVFLYSAHLSQITAVLKPKLLTVRRDVEITLDPSAESTDTSKNRIPAETLTLSVKTTEETLTTGIKIVGDQAKGKVIIYNKTEAEKRLAKGTVLATSEVQFTLDDEVVLPAAEVEERPSGKTVKFGERQADVTAFQIGVEGNIPAQTELTVDAFDKSTYSALSSELFTGGSSREVRVVAEADMTTLLKKAKETMLLDANRQFEAQAGNGKYVISTETIQINKQSFSHELGIEADVLSADFEAVVTTLQYSVLDLRPIATAALATEVPENYTIINEEPQIMSEPIGNLGADTEIIIAAEVTSRARPRYEEAQLIDEIKGKSLDDARDLLERRESVERVTFVHHPSWVRIFVQRLPNAAGRISVQQAEE